jgi:hypothetical protein
MLRQLAEAQVAARVVPKEDRALTLYSGDSEIECLRREETATVSTGAMAGRSRPILLSH